MLERLSGAQRFWLLFAVVSLGTAIALIAAAWPEGDPAVVADLRSPECRTWRDLPEGQFPDLFPEPGEQCYSIRSLLYHRHVNLRSEDDYDRYVAGERARTALRILGFWAGIVATLYGLGWASVRVARVLVKPGPGAGR